MINIGIAHTANNQSVPTISIHGKVTASKMDIAFMLYLLDTGMYGNLLRKKLESVLQPEQLQEINVVTTQLHSMHIAEPNHTDLVEAAKIPIIGPNQVIRSGTEDDD